MTTASNRDAYWNSPGALRTSDKLAASECWALATTEQTGRIGFFRDGLLDIFPVTYFVMNEHVYFRTSADGIIATSYLDHAAFQIDHVDRDAQNGWTILLNGPATRVEDPELLTTLWGKQSMSPGRQISVTCSTSWLQRTCVVAGSAQPTSGCRRDPTTLIS